MKRFALLASLLLLPLLAFAKPVSDRASGVSYTPPAGWESRDPGTVFQGVKAIYVGPVSQGFAANINWAAQQPSPVKTVPSKAPQDMVQMYKKTFAGYKLLGSKSITIGGKKALQVSSAYMMNTTPVRNQQVLFVHKGHLHTFTVTAHANSFAAAAGKFAAMLKTVRLAP